MHTVKYKAQLMCCARLTYGEGALGVFSVERGEFKYIIYYRCDLYFTHRTEMVGVMMKITTLDANMMEEIVVGKM